MRQETLKKKLEYLYGVVRELENFKGDVKELSEFVIKQLKKIK